jgi:UDP-hydrolysing UDP-N-acetyl-D-glucosamine 2-epimerase
MRTVAVVTVARSDYGIYLPILHKISASPTLRLHLIVSGMHLSPEFGLTANRIEEDGFEIGDRVEMLLSSDSPEGITKSMGLGVIGFAQVYARIRPDMIIVLGDRFEMHAAALAALPFKIPVAHLHGGEVTEGAIDDALRHSITKLSHLHFVSTEEYARRVCQLGEEAWRITVSGAPSLDNLQSVKLLDVKVMEERCGLSFNRPPLLVTFHPVTLEIEHTKYYVTELLAAVDAAGMPILFTLPNADTSGRLIREMIEAYVRENDRAEIVDNLGTQAYFSMMALATAMVGNSSSGIIEAASFKLPVVNIGTRQRGRTRGENVIDVGYSRGDIGEGIKRATDSGFRDVLNNLVNPYSCGNAAEKVVSVIENIDIDQTLCVKQFCDLSIAG